MAASSTSTNRSDPYGSYRFRLRWTGGAYVAGISKIGALRPAPKMAGPRKAGDPGARSFEPITLERGVTHDPVFERWAETAMSDTRVSVDGDKVASDLRRNLTIEVVNEAEQIVMAYNIFNCWVSEFQALPELDAGANAVAIQKLVLQHEGWERKDAV